MEKAYLLKDMREDHCVFGLASRRKCLRGGLPVRSGTRPSGIAAGARFFGHVAVANCSYRDELTETGQWEFVSAEL